jgi:N-acetylglutamate synthase-like GNAT family acetyltransferase
MIVMRVRKARELDFPQVARLARKYRLDYAGMEADAFWVVAERGQIRGICGLKKHPECLELCALGVAEKWRRRGLGERLVRAVVRKAGGELFLATVIPGYFARLGFEKAKSVPASMVKNAEWCAGCMPELCVVMVRRGGNEPAPVS